MKDWVVRRRALLVLGAAALLAVIDASYLYPTDLGVIADSGRKLLSSDWVNAFSDETVQVGPVQALLWGVVRGIAENVGFRPELAFAVFTHVAVVAGALGVSRAVQRSDQGGYQLRELILAVFILAWGITSEAFYSGHPEEIWIGLLWVLVGRASRLGRPYTPGALLALAAGIKQWGLLGLPILLLSRDRKHALINGGIAIGGTATLYLPFLLFGDYNTLDFSWAIEDYSFLHLIGLSGEFDWWMRLVQGGVTMGAGIVLAHANPDRYAEWLLPLQMITTRLVLDPLSFSYYWLAVETLLFIGVAASWERFSANSRVILLVASLLLVLVSYTSRGWVILIGAFIIALVSLVCFRSASGVRAAVGDN